MTARRTSRPSSAGVTIRSIPMWYRGIQFRSTLEADWAATFDSLGIYWEYEPVALSLDSGDGYVVDFRLPGQRVWCEVKGPHNERLSKAKDLQRQAGATEDLVVVLRPAGPERACNWHCADGDHNVRLSRCGSCSEWCFNRPMVDEWRCRCCRAQRLAQEASYISAASATALQNEFSAFGKNDWVTHWFGEYGRLPMGQAPRPRRSIATVTGP